MTEKGLGLAVCVNAQEKRVRNWVTDYWDRAQCTGSECLWSWCCDGDGVFVFYMASVQWCLVMCHYNAIYSTNSSEIWQYDIVSFFNSCYLQRISYCFVFVTSHTVCIQTTYTLRGAVTFPEYVISDILMVNIGTGTFMSLAPPPSLRSLATGLALCIAASRGKIIPELKTCSLRA